MLHKSRELCTQIAQAVFQLIPEEWTTAVVKAMMISDYAEMRSSYVPKRGGPAAYFTVGFKVHDLFEQLRSSMYEDLGAAWYIATLSLMADGTFSYQYDYEDT